MVFYEVAVGVYIEFGNVDTTFGDCNLLYRDSLEEGMDIYLVLILATR